VTRASGPIAAVIIVKNEANTIYEWLAHHAAIGVDRFIIYDNSSTDGTRDQIRAFPEQRHIRVIDWPMTFGQMPAYQDAISRFGPSCGWMAFIDADEFLIPLKGENLPAILADFADRDGLAVPWTVFGSNGHVARPGGLVLESFTRRAPDDFIVNRHTKCIMRPSRIAYVTTSPHIFIPKTLGALVREDGTAVDQDSSLLPEPFVPQRLRLHHYVVQSRADFALKQSRGLANPSQPRDEGFFDLHDRNEIEDEAALPFALAIRAYVARHRPAGSRRFPLPTWQKGS
jgi:glycosyltransferase involved in cell wall biosynthesis